MSYTEIFSISASHCHSLGETKNAWRGAMYVWNQIAQKYFGLDSFPSFDADMQKRVWNANNEHQLTDAEINCARIYHGSRSCKSSGRSAFG